MLSVCVLCIVTVVVVVSVGDDAHEGVWIRIFPLPLLFFPFFLSFFLYFFRFVLSAVKKQCSMACGIDTVLNRVPSGCR
jgi:hypothetical protein